MKYQKHPELQEYYQNIKKSPEEIGAHRDPATWFGMMEDLDGRIGVILDKIKELGIEDNTYVVVTSDNGIRNPIWTEQLGVPIHGTKWWAWQGGIRVPMIVKGPSIEAGSTFVDNIVRYDMLPTFVDWAGGDPSELEDIDGRILAGYLRGDSPAADFSNRYLYFHYPHYRTALPHSAIVSNNLKVVHVWESPDVPMLFDLAVDEGERNNIARERPADHKRLLDEMMRYFREVRARLPKVNPDYRATAYEAHSRYQDRVQYGAFEGERPLADDEREYQDAGI